MKKNIAAEIISHHKLIPGPISRKILTAIATGKELDSTLATWIDSDQLDLLRKNYLEKSSDLRLSRTPKYLPFYHLIKNKIPSFSWEINGDNLKPQVNFKSPKISKIRPSLLSLLLEKLNSRHDLFLYQNYQCTNLITTPIIEIIDALFKKITIFYPSEAEMELIVHWLIKGLSGEKLTIFSPICPDYATVQTGNKECPVQFTFEYLGNRNGIVGSWIAECLPDLVNILKSINIQLDVIVSMSDFEAFSAENVAKFNLTRKEFLDRITESTETFKKECKTSAKVMMFTELCNENNWNYHIEKMKERFFKKDFGYSKINHCKLMEITDNRKALYKRWHGEKGSLEKYIDVTLDQGLFYAVMGQILSEKFENCLVFAADNKVMRFFYSVTKPLPTLYLDRTYC